MLVNFKNLLNNDVEKVLAGKEAREYVHDFDRVDALRVAFKDSERDFAYVVCNNPVGRVLVHFKEDGLANEFYNFLVSKLVEGTDYVEVDVLTYGAI